MRFFPNPVQKNLKIKLGNVTNSNYKARVITVTAIEVLSKKVIATNSKTITLNTGNLASG